MSIMSQNFRDAFGGAVGAGTNRQDLPKAQTWLNVGYVKQVPSVEDPSKMEDIFVSLPVGIPLDTQEAINITSRNARFASFQSARNDLLTQIQAEAAKLQPGEEKIIGLGGKSPLCIQLRRVNEAAEAPAADESNVFAAPKLFG